MKALELQKSGYSEESLRNLFRSTRFISTFFDKAEPVHGVCFASGPESLQEAELFASRHLGLGTIVVPLTTLTPASLKHFISVIAGPGAKASNVGFVLPEFDRLAESLQAKFARVIQAPSGILWFPTVTDPRRLITPLQSALLVYLGLGPKNRMRFLLQTGQELMIDEGSLERSSTRRGTVV